MAEPVAVPVHQRPWPHRALQDPPGLSDGQAPPRSGRSARPDWPLTSDLPGRSFRPQRPDGGGTGTAGSPPARCLHSVLLGKNPAPSLSATHTSEARSLANSAFFPPFNKRTLHFQDLHICWRPSARVHLDCPRPSTATEHSSHRKAGRNHGRLQQFGRCRRGERRD